jgi:hypothetical protein
MPSVGAGVVAAMDARSKASAWMKLAMSERPFSAIMRVPAATLISE